MKCPTEICPVDNNKSVNNHTSHLNHTTMQTIQNTVTLSGNLGSAVQINQLGAGRRIARVNIATHDFVKESNGKIRRRTQWHRLIAWDITADKMQHDLTRGSFVMIHGKLVSRKYLNNRGQMQYMTEVLVTSYSILKSQTAA